MGYGTTGNADEDENYDIPFRTITLTTVPCSEEVLYTGGRLSQLIVYPLLY